MRVAHENFTKHEGKMFLGRFRSRSNGERRGCGLNSSD